jgi:hypothetical protein
MGKQQMKSLNRCGSGCRAGQGRSGLIASGLLALSLCMACFNVRPVEPPSSSASDWVSPTDYTILLSNLETAVARRNTQNYLRCFNADVLRFVPAPSVFNNNESIWINWSIRDEQTYLENALADLTLLAGNSLTLRETDLRDVSSDSLRYVGEYTLRMNHGDTTITQLFKGQVEWVIKVNAFNEWEIYDWSDIEAYPDSSWSLLKLRYIR